MNNDRIPAVAGSFYPEDPGQLQREVDDFLSGEVTSNLCPKALIVPHAGYCYSGVIAGQGYRYLRNANNIIKRVILLGPSHRVALLGCAIPSYDSYVTPLGNVTVDQQACQYLQDQQLVSRSDPVHQLEHSLEVHLPFLQRSFAQFSLVPIVIGNCDSSLVETLLTRLFHFFADDASTLVVVSTDLSHYHCYSHAQRLDNDTITKMLTFQTSLKPEDACGCFAVNGLLRFAQQQAWRIKLIKNANSGDTFGNKNEVVGYASFIFY